MAFHYSSWVILPKLWYFFHFFSLGFMVPFISLLLREKGFSAQEIGFTLCLLCLANLFGAPLWGYLVDFTSAPKLVICGSFICLLAAYFMLVQVSTKALVVTACCILFVASSAQGSTMDRCTMGYIKRAGKANAYGVQRTFGSISWGLSAWLAGLLQEAAGDSKWLWSAVAASGVGVLFIISIAVSDMPAPEAEVDKRPSLQGLRIISTSWATFSFFLMMMTFGMGFAVGLTFLFLYLQELGAPQKLLGLTVTVGALVEIPLFFLTPLIIEKIKVFGLLSLGVCACVIRLAGFCFLTNPWYVLIIEPLGGVTHACVWTAAVSHMSNIAPQGLETTAQGILSALTWGLGPLCGNLGGGFLYEHFHGVALFGTSSALMLLIYLTFAFTHWVNRRKAPKDLGNDIEVKLMGEADDGTQLAELPSDPQ